MTVFTTDEVAHAVFKALGIEMPECLTKFTLEVDYNGGPPTITMTTLTGKPPESTEPVTKKFRLEPIEDAPLVIARTRFGPDYTREPNEPRNLQGQTVNDCRAEFGLSPITSVSFQVTTDRRDRDGDILDPKGMTVAPHFKMDPLFGQIAMEVCGSFVKTPANPEFVERAIRNDFAAGVDATQITAEQMNADAVAIDPPLIFGPDLLPPLQPGERYIEKQRQDWLARQVEGCPDCYIGLSGQIEKCDKHRGEQA